MNKLQCTQDELLREAAKAGNQICKLHTCHGDFIKARHGYSHPEDIRVLYLNAFDALVTAGKLKPVLQNKDLELYTRSKDLGHIGCKEEARRVLLSEVELAGDVYKIHSIDGEFVQVGTHAFYDIEDERIFSEVLYELTRSGKLQIVWDSKELCRYELARPSYLPGGPIEPNAHWNEFGVSANAS